MIYLKNTTDAQSLMIPRNGQDVTSDLVLTLHDTVDLYEIRVAVVDLHTSNIYFNLAIALPDILLPGEYEYHLTEGKILVSSGILYIGEMAAEDNQHETIITYKQYEHE